jgi:Asp-tRNA(Asn)/Glu-tRNA(Gln) amidotransferase B subunit
MSFVDLNRSGVALMEIVSSRICARPTRPRPMSRSCAPFLRYLGTCDGDMEKGNLRADVNVSVRKPGAELGTRCEIKNVNSIRFIGQAIELRGARQIEILETAAPSSRRRGCSIRTRARRVRCATRRRRTTTATSPIPISCRSS